MEAVAGCEPTTALPKELVLLIFSFLSSKELGYIVPLVCRYWWHLSCEGYESNHLWELKCRQHYPQQTDKLSSQTDDQEEHAWKAQYTCWSKEIMITFKTIF